MSPRDFELGIGERVTFVEGRRQGLRRDCYAVVDDGRFVTLNGWQGRFSRCGWSGPDGLDRRVHTRARGPPR